jgi:5S rRNA maturation endonuclease (ribonuclease M5)
MAFIYADLDGQGERLRRVIATTLLLEDPTKSVKKATKKTTKTAKEELPTEVKAVLDLVNQGLELLRQMGYDAELK